MSELAQLHCDVIAARQAVLDVLRRGGAAWPCPHCNAQRSYGHSYLDWWGAGMLCEAAGIDGPAAMIAINNLVGDGTLEQNSRLYVRLAVER